MTKDACSGILYVISGPSGSGKTTLVGAVKALPGVFYSVSVTTRQPRPGEAEGVDYHFATREEFERMAAEGNLAEYAEVAGNLYGTPREPLMRALAEGKTAIVDIDVQGAMQIREKCPEARLVFIEPPSMAILEERLRGRGTESEEAVQRRLALAAREMLYAPRYPYHVINDDLDRAVRALKAIVEGRK